MELNRHWFTRMFGGSMKGFAVYRAGYHMLLGLRHLLIALVSYMDVPGSLYQVRWVLPLFVCIC